MKLLYMLKERTPIICETPRYVEGETRREIRNIEIRQDGLLELVRFNYDFVINDKVHHSGLEVWQVCKIDGQWKILSVAWTIYP